MLYPYRNAVYAALAAYAATALQWYSINAANQSDAATVLLHSQMLLIAQQ